MSLKERLSLAHTLSQLSLSSIIAVICLFNKTDVRTSLM